MNEFLKMDIFFVVASVAAIAVAIFLCVALFYLIRVMKGMDRIVRQVEEEATVLRQDLAGVRAAAKEESAKIRGLLHAFEAMLRSLVGPKKRSARKPKSHPEASS